MYSVKSIINNKRLTAFIRGVLLMTVTAVIMRASAVYFNGYLNGKLGADGIGLFTLITSVYGFAVTFATSAINLATTRLVSESLGIGSDCSVRDAMKKCLAYSLTFGISGAVILFVASYPIGAYLLKDVRTVSSLRLFALTLPCISVSSALNGYFTAVRRVNKNAIVQITEQAIRIGGTIALISLFISDDLERACLCVVGGGCIADLLSFLYSMIMYYLDMKKHIGRDGTIVGDQRKKLLSIALPVALSSYLRSGLVTIEHLLIPWGLNKLGNSRERALATYGVMHAMALPIIMFPYALLSPFCAMLIPEISGRRAAGDKCGIERASSAAYGFVMIFGIGVSGIMSCYSHELGNVIYHSAEAAAYIRLLAPLVPIMYLDTVTDSILKGMDEQLYTMRVNIADAFISVIIVFLLVPRIGIYGYIAEIFLCELINASLSVWKLLTVVKIRVKIISRIVAPLLCIIVSTVLSKIIFSYMIVTYAQNATTLTMHILLTAALYIALTALCDRIISRVKERRNKAKNGDNSALSCDNFT